MDGALEAIAAAALSAPKLGRSIANPETKKVFNCKDQTQTGARAVRQRMARSSV